MKSYTNIIVHICTNKCIYSYKHVGIKHAVIRKDVKTEILVSTDSVRTNSVSTDSPKSPEYVYRCGKVGPCDSLSEVLKVINDILPSGLLLGICM
jgi:hypothetical protein